MTKYLDPKFTVSPGDSETYRDNYDSVFRKKVCPDCEETENVFCSNEWHLDNLEELLPIK